MTTNKNVSSSSMLDFKAEFLKKKQEFQSKLQSNTSHSKSKIISTPLQNNLKCETTVSTSSSKLKQSSNDNINSIPDQNEDNDRLELSRKKLIEKAKKYESLQKEFPKAKDDEDCLVDFEKKSYQRRYESDEDDIDSSKHLEEHNWIEFTDSLGRVRKCLPEDLEEYKRRDKQLQRDQNEFDTDEVGKDQSNRNYASEEVKDLHYEELRESEIRTHGVGFYSFSVDKTEREAQLSQLQEMHRQTDINRAKRHDINVKRKALLQKRLDQVRINRGLPPAPKIDIPLAESNDDNLHCEQSIAAPSIQHVTTPGAETVEDSTDRKRPAQRPPMREWDRGKSRKFLSQEDYVEKEREKRNLEFAPPSIYKP